MEHRIVLSAWDIPSPVNKNELFIVKVGARCTGNCPLRGAFISVMDHDGEEIAQALLDDSVLAGTNGTYYVEFELLAPAEEGVFTWKAACVAPETEFIHRAEALDFSFRTAPPSEHKVTVQVISSRDRIPLETSNVMLGLRRTFTDEQGIAVAEAPGGKQLLRVSKQDYRSFAEEIDLNDDLSYTIELVYDPAL